MRARCLTCSLAIALIAALAGGYSPDVAAQPAAAVAAQIAKAVPGGNSLPGRQSPDRGAAQALRTVYTRSVNNPLWSRDGHPTPQAQGLLRELQNADAYGLRVAGALEALAGSSDVSRQLASVEPPFYHYHLLKDQLSLYLKLAQQPELTQRVRQIDLTLERWRWLPPFQTPPILVNIPQFRLFAFRATEDRAPDILQMDVIVGKIYPRMQTPVFESNMTYVVIRPYWDVPRSITVNEMLPKIRANPGYVAAQRLQIVSGQSDSSPAVAPTPENIDALAAGRLRLRQVPGEDTALGLIKFMFPNSYNVYLHSTPAHRLFKESVRAFSHGCIRVSDPLALATDVLNNAPGDWTREKIAAAMNDDKTIRVNLTQPINVLILYGTALATEAGPILFFDDIYGYDRKLERELGLAPAY
jgi:murein L,D-transpeptidase YcbB/YkuD